MNRVLFVQARVNAGFHVWCFCRSTFEGLRFERAPICGSITFGVKRCSIRGEGRCCQQKGSIHTTEALHDE